MMKAKKILKLVKRNRSVKASKKTNKKNQKLFSEIGQRIIDHANDDFIFSESDNREPVKPNTTIDKKNLLNIISKIIEYNDSNKTNLENYLSQNEIPDEIVVNKITFKKEDKNLVAVYISDNFDIGVIEEEEK